MVAIGIEGWPLRLDFLGRKSVYAAHQSVARSPSSQRDRVSLLDGAAPARSHATRFAGGLPILDQGGANGLRREWFAFMTRSAATN